MLARLPAFRKWIAVAVLAGVTAAVHGPRLGQEPMSVDEETSLIIARGISFRYIDARAAHEALPLQTPFFTTPAYAPAGVRAVVRSTLADNGNSILYYPLLNAWLRAAPQLPDLRWVRLFSLVCIAAAASALGLAVRRAGSTRPVALLCALLLVCHPLVGQVAVVARAYGLALLTLSLLWLHYVRMARPGRRAPWSYAVFAALGLAAFSAHYFAVLPVAMLSALLGRKAWPVRKERLAWSLACVVMLAAATLYGLAVREAAGVAHIVVFQKSLGHAAAVGTGMGARGITGLVSDAAGSVASLMGAAAGPMQRWTDFLSAALAAGGAWALVAGMRLRSAAPKPTGGLAALWVVGSAVLIAVAITLVAGHTFIFQPRFFALFAPFVAVALVGGLNTWWKAPPTLQRIVALAALLLLCGRCLSTGALAVWRNMHPGVAAAEPLEAAMKQIRHRARGGDTVVYRSWRLAQTATFFLGPNSSGVVQQVDTAAPASILHRRAAAILYRWTDTAGRWLPGDS